MISGWVRISGRELHALAGGEDPSQIIPLFERHLDLCGNCREELEALPRIMQAS